MLNSILQKAVILETFVMFYRGSMRFVTEATRKLFWYYYQVPNKRTRVRSLFLEILHGVWPYYGRCTHLILGPITGCSIIRRVYGTLFHNNS